MSTELADVTVLGNGPRERVRYPAGITLRLDGNGQVRETVTYEGGRFLFDDLEPGTYRVQTMLPGFRPTTYSDDRHEIDLTRTGCARLRLSVEQNRTR